MLSILFGEAPDVFKQVVEFYAPNARNVADLTFGHGKLWSSFVNCVLRSNDTDPQSPAMYHLPIAEFIVRTKEICGADTWDLVVIDPPYKYEGPSHNFGIQEKDKDWQEVKTKWTLDQHQKMIDAVNSRLPQKMNDESILLVKIMDTRIPKGKGKSELILNHFLWIDLLSNFVLVDYVVYIRTMVGLFANKKTAQVAHGFYLVFKRRSS